ncbi:MAG: 30S ribosomal protein S21 [Bacteroidetes bacterium]|nr:30S ribosomal protein S21 [Bacteroidota bacterium]
MKNPILQGLKLNFQSIQEGSAVPVGIKVRDNESIDRALRRFKRAVNRSRVLRIYRANMAFTKPSEERRLAREKSLRNSRRRRY